MTASARQRYFIRNADQEPDVPAHDLVDLDPQPNRQLDALERWLRRAANEFEKSILTAAIIEMGLLNCTCALKRATEAAPLTAKMVYHKTMI